MQVSLKDVGPDERPVLRNLFSFYFQNLSQYDPGIDLNQYGLPVWSAFGGDTPRTHDECVTYNWWIRDQCRLFLVLADGAVAGFVIVNAGPAFLPDGIDYDIQDFFIAAKYRRKGVGRAAARLAFDRFRGRWEVVQLPENAAAIAFWNRVVGEYTLGHYETLDSGARQRFSNAKA